MATWVGSNGNAPVFRTLASALAFLAGGPVANDAVAQSGFYVTPSVSVTQVYDDNIFATASRPEDDYITRVTPALESGYRAERLTVNGRLSVDAEAFAEHDELSSSQARRHAAFDFSFEPTRRFTLEATAGYTRTNRAEELSPDTGLELGRTEVERISLGPSAEYRFDARTTGTGGYMFTREELGTGARIHTHAASFQLERRVTRRDSGSVGYTFRRFLFEGDDNVSAHLMSFGWTRELTPRTRLVLHGGPRFSGGEVDPEGSASLHYRLERGELSFTYARGLATVLGEAEPAETTSYSGSLRYDVSRSFELSATPSFHSVTSGGAEADVYRLNLDAHYRLNRYLSFVGAWQFSLQKGTLGGSSGEIERNVLWVGLVLSYPPRRVSGVPAAQATAGLPR